jgi:type III secretion protein Q
MNALLRTLSRVAGPAVRPLAGLLPAIAPEAAAACRIGFDARLPDLLRGWLREPALAIRARKPAANRLRATIDSALGSFSVDIEPNATSAWTLLHALARSNAASDTALACAVATELLEREADRRGVDLRGARIERLAPVESAAGDAAPVPVIVVGGLELALAGTDARFGLELCTALQVCDRPPSARLQGLLLPGRLEVSRRLMRAALLRTLEGGDLLVVGLRRQPAVFRVGAGAGLSARATLDIDTGSVCLAAPLSPDAGEAQMHDDADTFEHALDDIDVPVRFEIDTARLSLDALAALEPGQVITLDTRLIEANVIISCHGQRIGSGQLVAVADRLGVRIDRMRTTGKQP